MGPGFVHSQAKISNILFNGVEKDVFDTVNKDRVFYPMEKIDNPKSNPDHPQDYSDEEIIEMVYDMEEASNYVVPFDQLSIFSQNLAEGTLEEG